MTITSRNTWEYKPPAAKDIPQDFRVTLLPNARNPHGVLSSKVMCLCPIILMYCGQNAGNWRACPSYGHLCSFLHLGRPQLQQVWFCRIYRLGHDFAK